MSVESTPRSAPGEEKNQVAAKVVWSSDAAEECPVCKRRAEECQCQQRVAEGVAKLRIEKRRGKTVTVIAEIPLELSDVKLLLRDLKKRCATGGTCKGTSIELQGDQVQVVRKWLDGCSIAHRGWD